MTTNAIVHSTSLPFDDRQWQAHHRRMKCKAITSLSHVARPALFPSDKFEARTRRSANDLHHGQAAFVLKPNRDKQHMFGIASRRLLG